MKEFNIKVHLFSQAKGIPHTKVKNTYTKDGMYCVLTQDDIVYKYPMSNIFRVEEPYV